MESGTEKINLINRGSFQYYSDQFRMLFLKFSFGR